eukprot:gene14873-4416_t
MGKKNVAETLHKSPADAAGKKAEEEPEHSIPTFRVFTTYLGYAILASLGKVSE